MKTDAPPIPPCPRCGTPLVELDEYCIKCGRPRAYDRYVY